jgi:DNA-binding CsgD family transcriptional regulator
MDGHFANRLAPGRYALLVADAQGRRLDGNAAALELLGLSREELRSLRVDDLVAGELREAVARGGRHVSISLVPTEEPLRNARATLTSRECEVVRLVAQGATSDEIAERLFISPTTVETHVRKAMGRLGARNRAHLIALAIRAGEI